ncbi:hypothetical protein DOY81_005518 [Sarcophaga bullata]|nr:hypothetical protein DOY81_005518 [Sarcophaga bullata]
MLATYKQQQKLQNNIANNKFISRLLYPSISANSTNSSTSFKASNISHIKTASVEIVSGFTDTGNNLIKSSIKTSACMATKTLSSLSTESAPCTTLALATTSCNQNMNPSLHTMTIPTQSFPPSLSQSQSSSAALNNNNDNNKTTTTVNFSNQNHSNLKNFTLATSPMSDAETTIPNLNDIHQNMNSSKTILTSTTSSSISSQRSSTTASLLFVSPANPSRTLHVGKLPFLPVQFI